MSERNGDWISTYTGREFWPIDPRVGDVDIRDIAHSLSMQCRFTGHTRLFYSVAEHSIRVAELCPDHHKLWALLHDASEAYLVDLPRPIKRHTEIGRHYREAETRLMEVICRRFDLCLCQPPNVERADKAMLAVESRDLMPAHTAWSKWHAYCNGEERPILSTWLPGQAEDAFLQAFEKFS